MKERLLTQLRNLLESLTEGNRTKFARIYPDFLTLDISQLKNAVNLCERTFQKNLQSKKALDELFLTYAHKILDFQAKFPHYTEDSAVDESMLKDYSDFLTFVPAPVIPQKLPITHGLVKVADSEQLDFDKFTDEADAREYFKDEYRELIPCGLGQYADEVKVKCYIDSVLFEAHLKADVWKQRCDVGEDVYYANSLESITFTAISQESEKESIRNKKLLKLEKLKAEVAVLEAELA